MPRQYTTKRLTPAEIFARYCGSPNANGCMLWSGAVTNRGGYGEVNHLGGRIRAHRLAWILAHGEISDDLCVLHRCDVPLCVNVAHLFLGSRTDNMDDKVRKGRQQKGEAVPQSRLNAETVREIRRRYAAGGVLMRELAAEYGVHAVTIYDIVRFRTWKHVE